MINMPTKKPRVSLVIPEHIKKDLEKLAQQDGRSVSNYVLRIIEKEIARAKKDQQTAQ
jgi:predicted DNA-binding protein